MQKLEEFPNFFESAKASESEAFDVRFEETVSLIEQERFSEAVSLIEPILKEGCLDIRLVMYLFYAHFLEKGLQCLKLTFDHISLLLNEQQEKISPTQMREKHTQSSLVWFFSSIGKKLRRSERLYKENRPDDFWENAIEVLSPEALDELKEATTSLIDFLGKKWEGHPINQHVMFLSKWLDDLNSAQKEEKPVPPPQKIIPRKVEIEKPASLPSPVPQETLEGILLSSDEIKHFYQKIQTFESLIKKRDFTKAALVADDIRNIIQNFNPSSFFPKLFSNYFSLTAKHITTLSEEWESKGSLTWNSLEQLYHTDLDAFIHW